MDEHNELRTRLRAVGMELFRRDGLRFTMQQAAAMMHISKKTIYAVYPSKEALLLDMVDDAFTRIHARKQRILDGPGTMAEKLRAVIIALPEEYTALDLQQMDLLAKRGNFSSKLYFSVQDMFHLPYADQSFDVVIVSNALHIVPHPEKALIEFRRVLKNDGTLIAPTFTHAENSPWGNLQALALKIAGFPLHSRWTSAAYLAFLQQNGWTVCKSVVLQNSIPLTYAECKKVERR